MDYETGPSLPNKAPSDDEVSTTAASFHFGNFAIASFGRSNPKA